ncbi:GumC family protein [Mucilaginibacter gotjawali]|uniref:Uncharacterized protein n=2 Tax=Mucilaginibacter gotjawali TaxID=1550579 RepID=A0A0X8X7J5_9SPHI|nr:hypothetical protein [Mucilaginibacter gotjawali]MBB3058151.1 uncharacterized protein involved in exopolysaccharide biosynthesis [Mucilaginibacter gotjawali]BAU54894.1 hypothetical protein MgSA37_03073 [Mucilaginibacter gotjawali]
MKLIHYIKLLLKYTHWLILVPVICAATVFLLTKHSKKQYTSTTTLYTGVASGYSITTTEDQKLDYFGVNNAFDNLLASAKSRETMEEVAIRLLSEHLALKKPDPKVLDADGFIALKKVAGNDLLQKSKGMKDAQSIYDYLSYLHASKVDNIVAEILSKPGSFYSVDELKSNLVVTRISTSDMIQVVYSCSDPAVCQRTLELHSNIFIANYRRLKADQTLSAVQYFEAKLAEARAKLQGSENNIKQFGQQNRIINYYEQTRYIAQSKEELDKEIYAEKIAQKGSQRALDLVEKKLNSREKQITNSLDVIKLRQHLSDANANIERAKIYGNADKMNEYLAEAKKLEDSLKTASNQYMSLNYTLETVPRTSLVQQWVDNAVSLDKANAGLAVLNQQSDEYLKKFDQFAPLGSTLKRLDRQADIDEKEYLSILSGLNLARLRQSNLALNSNIAVQDKAYFPLQPLASTRALLIALSFFVGFLMVSSVVIARELMDSSIRSPERAAKIMNIPVAGISAIRSNARSLSYQPPLRSLLTERFVNAILPFISAGIEAHGKAQVSFITTKDNVFQTDDIKLLNEYLSSLYNNLVWVVPESLLPVFSAAVPAEALVGYLPAVAQLNSKIPDDLVNKDLSANRLILYVTPNLAKNSLPVSVARKSSLNLMVFNANDTWQPVDRDLLNKTRALTPDIPVYTWLTQTDESNLDGIIGEIPKRRSWLRKKVKKMLTLNLR